MPFLVAKGHELAHFLTNKNSLTAELPFIKGRGDFFNPYLIFTTATRVQVVVLCWDSADKKLISSDHGEKFGFLRRVDYA